MKIQFLLFVAALLFCRAAFAQKYSNEFLAIGVGARAQAMGGAQAASVDDITAGYWNPAGLTQIAAPAQIGAMHAEWFAGVAQYDYLSFGTSLNREKNSYLAFSLIRLGIDNIPYTINLVNTDGTVNYDNLSSFSASDYAMLGSYAQQLKNPAFSVGGTFKVIHRTIGKIGQSWGFGADAGIQYRKGRWMFGLQGRDLTTTFNAWSFDLTEREKEVFTATNNEIPSSNTEITRPRFILGGAYKFKLNQKSSLLSALDFEVTTDGQRNVLVSSRGFNGEPRLGFEYDYNRQVQVRAGLSNFQRVKNDFNADDENLTMQPNFGLGLRLGRVQLDYTLTDIGNVSQVSYSHIFSLKLDIKERRQTGNN